MSLLWLKIPLYVVGIPRTSNPLIGELRYAVPSPLTIPRYILTSDGLAYRRRGKGMIWKVGASLTLPESASRVLIGLTISYRSNYGNPTRTEGRLGILLSSRFDREAPLLYFYSVIFGLTSDMAYLVMAAPLNYASSKRPIMNVSWKRGPTSTYRYRCSS